MIRTPIVVVALVTVAVVVGFILSSAPIQPPAVPPVATIVRDAQPARLDDPASPFAHALRALPGVVTVEAVAPPKPTTRIVHIRSLHYVSHDDLAADLRDQILAITEGQIDQQYARLLLAVEATTRASRWPCSDR
jgi:hypothetical protein